MYKRIYLILLSLFVSGGILAGCGSNDGFKIQPMKPDGQYSTQNPGSALEYGIYMNKQITVFVNQLSTRMIASASTDTVYSGETELAEQSIQIMKDARDEVEVTYPAVNAEDDRETVLKAMNTAIGNVENYVETLKNGGSVESYTKIFQSDINQLTGLANLYYE